MKINSSLLPMKFHYFFMFAGTAPLIPFLPVYAKQNLNLSYTGIGLIYTILPFVGLLAKASSGTLADWLNAHRKIFLGAVVICALGFLSIYFVPALDTKSNTATSSIQFDCSIPSSYLRHKFDKAKCGAANNFLTIKKNDTATCEVVCDTVTPEQNKEICELWKIPDIQCTEVGLEITTFSQMRHLIEDDAEIFFPIENLTYATTKVRMPSCHPIMRFNCTTKCDDDDLMIFLGEPNSVPYSTYSDLVTMTAFWTYFVAICIAWSGLAVLVVMSDTICFQILGPNGSKYGRQRMFGSMGWGLFVIITGLLIDLYSPDDIIKDYAPAFILTGFLLSVDFLVATRLKVEREEKARSDFSAFTKLFKDPRICLFILCCVIVGVSTGVLWTYQLILVETVAFNWDCEFKYMKLLQGLIIGMSCFGGEIPFFFLSGKIIKYLGHVHSMSLVMAVFGVRFILYYTVVNPWYFIPIELLSGFTFGIFYAVMTSYANIVSPPGSQATMQGIVGASFEGLGIATGGFLGGALFSSVGGSYTFLIVGVFNICYASCHFLGQIVLNKIKPLPDSPHHGGYLPPSDSLNPVADEEEPLNEDPRA